MVFSRLLDYLDGIYGVVYRSETSDHGRRRSFVAVTPSLTGETLVGATHVGVGNLQVHQILFVTRFTNTKGALLGYLEDSPWNRGGKKNLIRTTSTCNTYELIL